VSKFFASLIPRHISKEIKEGQDTEIDYSFKYNILKHEINT